MTELHQLAPQWTDGVALLEMMHLPVTTYRPVASWMLNAADIDRASDNCAPCRAIDGDVSGDVLTFDHLVGAHHDQPDGTSSDGGLAWAMFGVTVSAADPTSNSRRLIFSIVPSGLPPCFFWLQVG